MFDTDHFMIETSLQIPPVALLKKQGKRRLANPKVNVSQLKEPEKQRQYVNLLNEKCTKEPTNDIERLNNTIIELINQSTPAICQQEAKEDKKHHWENF